MSTRDIRTSNQHTSCDVCGRTLLRGERSEVYLNGGTRRSVCELCTARALHEGWVREGTVPAYDRGDAAGDRRRSLLGKLRARREPRLPSRSGASTWDEPEDQAWPELGAPGGRPREPVREPRHVHAVPTSVEHRVAAAVELFNGSEHRRTIAGVARSLGVPTVSVLASDSRASVVNAVVSWELCWYRYEVDLSEEVPIVRVAAQGYELDELGSQERQPNARADEHGGLALGV